MDFRQLNQWTRSDFEEIATSCSPEQLVRILEAFQASLLQLATQIALMDRQAFDTRRQIDQILQAAADADLAAQAREEPTAFLETAEIYRAIYRAQREALARLH